MEHISTEFEKLVKKQKLTCDQTQVNIDKLINQINDAKQKIENDSSQSSTTLTILTSKLKTLSSQVIDNHKELHSSISKYSKSIDKKLKINLDTIWKPNVLLGKEDILNSILMSHFVREGQFELAEIFSKESNIPISDEMKNQFQDLFNIVEAIKKKDLKLALNWASEKRYLLKKNNSNLEFELHKLQYIQFLISGDTFSAIQYAKKNFSLFSETNFKDIKRLACSLLFIKHLENSPYSDLLAPSLWDDIEAQFKRDFCSIYGFSSESPLYTAVMVGASSIPPLIKVDTILKVKKNLDWSANSELPVEIPLLDSQRYHSVFSCPVSKEQVDCNGKDNYPTMLLCGHIISKESLLGLCKGNNIYKHKFKCPYCPTESIEAQARRVYF
ncbi:hypothetical protein BCR36DRAFT_279244 [Piromyces finnis]|uniref:GID complex catalytic subunit 2 n=1 Tax=Piromyces finnis TaxID=1754191 RepID=A0A1Y1VIQ2_9FUNG|nr:hypothetical protein BCR36DRAFT_279244 [Piromyces finnis]|eukprot:ORX57273.1 hypothetical protein BCR36DRAFT_279244 [Piromyces finnis]